MTTERSPSSPRHFDAPATDKLTPTTSLRTAGHAVDPIIHSVAGANRDAILFRSDTDWPRGQPGTTLAAADG
jgi:hypothetical protein